MSKGVLAHREVRQKSGRITVLVFKIRRLEDHAFYREFRYYKTMLAYNYQP